MIRFSCRCGYVFEAPADAAGIGLQCPECHLLNDVPFLSETATIATDGTYKVDVRPKNVQPQALDDLLHVYGNKTIDDFGEPIDLRNSAGDMDDVGEYDVSDDSPKRRRPRYDPETGELVNAIPLANAHEKTQWIDPSSIPFANTTLSYAANGAIGGKTMAFVLDLLQPINMVTMGFVLGIHLCIAALTFAIAMRFLLVAPIALFMLLAIVAHYGNVVDEIGPGAQDELPRIMRDLQWSEDIWNPLISIFGAAIICYGPAILLASKSNLSPIDTAAFAGGLTIVGTFLMPAILLTLLTSGSPANLRPDRILGVIRQSGLRYFGAIIAFVVAMIPYAWGVSAFLLDEYAPWHIPGWLTSWPVTLPMLCFGIFAMHFFCWELGMLYRFRSESFPWINQFHVREPRPPVRRRKPKYIAAPPREESAEL